LGAPAAAFLDGATDDVVFAQCRALFMEMNDLLMQRIDRF
jgi:hypothetical protein